MMFVKNCWYLQVSSGITRYREGSKNHIYDTVPNNDFPVLQCFVIVSSVSSIRSDRAGKYMSKI